MLFYYRHQLEALPPEQIIPHLNLNPNETVYDIGAGYGFFTFPIAQKLQGTGKIYATELNNDRLFLVRFNKFLHRIENVHPRIVAAQGVDPLYLQDKADLILLAEVYEYLPEPIKYFKELRNALKPHGRIVIISGRTTPAMTPSAIRDFAGFIQELARLDISHPLKNQQYRYFLVKKMQKNSSQNNSRKPYFATHLFFLNYKNIIALEKIFLPGSPYLNVKKHNGWQHRLMKQEYLEDPGKPCRPWNKKASMN